MITSTLSLLGTSSLKKKSIEKLMQLLSPQDTSCNIRLLHTNVHAKAYSGYLLANAFEPIMRF